MVQHSSTVLSHVTDQRGGGRFVPSRPPHTTQSSTPGDRTIGGDPCIEKGGKKDRCCFTMATWSCREVVIDVRDVQVCNPPRRYKACPSLSILLGGRSWRDCVFLVCNSPQALWVERCVTYTVGAARFFPLALYPRSIKPRDTQL